MEATPYKDVQVQREDRSPELPGVYLCVSWKPVQK